MKSVRIPAHAKVNLRLDVLGRRADGYHELRTIFQAISLHDTLVLEAMPKPGVDLRIDGNAQLAGEPGENNLVYRALDELGRELGLRQGVRALLTKRIPVGRGMGGGSSDAAAALVGLLRLAGKRVPLERLMTIASGLGSDVPFFLQGGRALGIGRGEEIYPLPDVPKRTVLVISPHEIAVPTKDAYRWISEGQSEELTNRQDPTRLLQFCALCWSPQGAPSQTILRLPFSPGIPAWMRSRGSCFSKEPQGPRWLEVVRRCLESINTQRWRAELHERFRRIRFFSAQLFRGWSIAERWARSCPNSSSTRKDHYT